LPDRFLSELAIDAAMAFLFVAGSVLVLLGPAGDRVVVSIEPALKGASAGFGLLTGVFWGLFIVRALSDKSGKRAVSVDILDLAIAVVALTSPALLLVGPDLMRHRADVWVLLPMLELAVFTPGIAGASILVFARLPRHQRRTIGMLVLLLFTSIANAWGQIVEILHNWKLPVPLFIFVSCLNFSLIMLLPLFETQSSPQGLDRLSPKAQLRRWNWIPLLLAGGIVWLVITTEQVRSSDGQAFTFTLCVLVLMVFLATARHFLTVGETQGLYADLEDLAKDMYELSRTDPLTGLSNRRALFEGFSELSGRSTEDGSALSVVMLDLDNFKDYNDEFGHLAGDGMLEKLAGLLMAVARTDDIVARFGGEEFCLVLFDCEGSRAVGILESVLLQCTDGIETGDGVSFSAGVAQWDGSESTDKLMTRADKALYMAKAAGRSRVLQAGTVPVPRPARVDVHVREAQRAQGGSYSDPEN
jgi:diguanylate cyclase (GGDEF)-like protein